MSPLASVPDFHPFVSIIKNAEKAIIKKKKSKKKALLLMAEYASPIWD